MRRIRQLRKGFTLTEVLISIAVISVAILGTIAAIAFGLRAANVGGQDSVALSINRKVIELILQNQFSPDNSLFLNKPIGDPAHDLRTSSNWVPLYYTTSGGAPAGWFTLKDYGFTEGTADANQFIDSTRSMQMNISCKKPDARSGITTAMDVDQSFYQIVVTTRWQDKNRWRWLTTKTLSTEMN